MLLYFIIHVNHGEQIVASRAKKILIYLYSIFIYISTGRCLIALFSAPGVALSFGSINSIVLSTGRCSFVQFIYIMLANFVTIYNQVESHVALKHKGVSTTGRRPCRLKTRSRQKATWTARHLQTPTMSVIRKRWNLRQQ